MLTSVTGSRVDCVSAATRSPRGSPSCRTTTNAAFGSSGIASKKRLRACVPPAPAPTATIGGLLTYANETVISSELLSASFPNQGLGQTTGEETGLVSFHNRRELARFTPNFSYDFTPRIHLRSEGQYENVSFNENITQLDG